jgi:hypothetical protein
LRGGGGGGVGLDGEVDEDEFFGKGEGGDSVEQGARLDARARRLFGEAGGALEHLFEMLDLERLERPAGGQQRHDRLEDRRRHGGREIGELALAVAERLDPRAHPLGIVADCRTAALAHLGDAQRRCEDLAAAERSFAAAWRSLDEGSGDPLERANVMRMEALLRLALGETERGGRVSRSLGELAAAEETLRALGRKASRA